MNVKEEERDRERRRGRRRRREREREKKKEGHGRAERGKEAQIFVYSRRDVSSCRSCTEKKWVRERCIFNCRADGDADALHVARERESGASIASRDAPFLPPRARSPSCTLSCIDAFTTTLPRFLSLFLSLAPSLSSFFTLCFISPCSLLFFCLSRTRLANSKSRLSPLVSRLLSR